MEQTEQQKKVSLIPYLMKYKWHYLAGIVLLLVVDLANLYVPRYMGDIIDGLTEGAFGMEGVIPLLWKILAAGAAMMVGRFGWRYFIFGAARGIEYRLRDDMFSHLETLSARYFNSHKTGDLMAHFTNDLQAVRMAVGPAVVTVFDAVVMTVMVLFQMVVYVDLQLTVLAFVPLTLVAVGCYFYGIEAKKRQTRRQEAFSSLSDKVQESLSGVRVLKAFVQEEEDFKAFARASENVKEKNLAVVKLRAVFGPSLDAVTGISLLLTLIFGGKMVLAGTISVGQFVAFTTYISMLVWPMIACGDCINMFSQASAAFQRISCIFREEPDIVDREGIPEGEDVKIRGELTLKDLTFTYPDGEEPVLQSVNLHVKAGEMLGILGRTGSGKSSLADLLLRVYDCQEGSLLVDGRPITEFPLAVLHRDMAYVPQDNFLFSDTIARNIDFTESVPDRERVSIAASLADVDNDVKDFPLGYDTVLGERGVTVSGGQKQRISIARALMKNAPILILDDSVSAVDTQTERAILDNLAHTRQGRTTILIAHRISTIEQMDKVIFIDDGKIIAMGPHAELYENCKAYRHMVDLQKLEEEGALHNA